MEEGSILTLRRITSLSRLLLLRLRDLSQKKTMIEHNTTTPPIPPTALPTMLPTCDDDELLPILFVISGAGLDVTVELLPARPLELWGEEFVDGKEPFVTIRKSNVKGVCPGLPVYLAESV